MELFIDNACSSISNDILIIHPYTGNFINSNESKQCDGSSKIIIDKILNIPSDYKMIINVVFIEIFQNHLCKFFLT